MAVAEQNGIGIETIEDVVDLLKTGDYKRVISEIEQVELTPADLSEYAHFNSERYFRNCIFANDDVELILLCWDANQKTAIHCHDEKECFVKIVEGTIKEEQYIYDDKLMKLIPTGSEILTNGETSFIDDAQLFHSLENLNDTRAMSLHMYMKPIQKCKVYNEQKGRLVELSLSYDSYAGVLIA